MLRSPQRWPDAVRPQAALSEAQYAPLSQNRVRHNHQHHDEPDVDAYELRYRPRPIRADLIREPIHVLVNREW